MTMTMTIVYFDTASELGIKKSITKEKNMYLGDPIGGRYFSRYNGNSLFDITEKYIVIAKYLIKYMIYVWRLHKEYIGCSLPCHCLLNAHFDYTMHITSFRK